MKDIQSFIEPLKSHLKLNLLEIHLDPVFASHISNNRNSIRQNILDRYQAQMTNDEQHVMLDLEQLPTTKNLFFSISHMKHHGGYAVSDEKIGFDVEDISRISTQVVERITSSSEIFKAPQLEFLWSAKEAVFKVASPIDNLVIKDVEITGWSAMDDIHFFHAQINRSSTLHFQGALLKISDNIMVALAKLDRAQS